MYNKKPFIGNILKEILPYNSRYMTMDISELPAEVLSKIASYYVGEPEYAKLNHNKALRKIQSKQKSKHYKKYQWFIKEFDTMKKTHYFFEVKNLCLDEIFNQEHKIEEIVKQHEQVINFYVRISILYFDNKKTEQKLSVMKSFDTWYSISDILCVVYWFYFEVLNVYSLNDKIHLLDFDVYVYSRI